MTLMPINMLIAALWLITGPTVARAGEAPSIASMAPVTQVGPTAMKELIEILQDYVDEGTPDTYAVYYTPATRLRMAADAVERRERLRDTAGELLRQLKTQEPPDGK